MSSETIFINSILSKMDEEELSLILDPFSYVNT